MKTVVTNAKEYQINDFLNHAATNCDKLSNHGLNGRKGRYEVIKELFDNIMNTIRTSILNIIDNENGVKLFITSIATPFSEAVAVFGKNAKYARALSCLIESDIAKKVFNWSKYIIDNLEMKQVNQINDMFNVGIVDKFSFFSFTNKEGGKMLLLNIAHTFIKIIDSLWNNEEMFHQTQNLVSTIMDKFMKTSANKLVLSKDKKSRKIYEKEFRWIIVFKLKYAIYNMDYNYKSMSYITAQKDCQDEMAKELKSTSPLDVKNMITECCDTMEHFRDNAEQYETAKDDKFLEYVSIMLEEAKKAGSIE